MKNILLTIIITTFLYSCDEKVYFDIPQNEKPLLNNNDTVYFSDSKNNIDTFIIKLTDEYEVSDKRYYHERITVSYQKINKSFWERFIVQQGEATSVSVYGYYFPSIYKNDLVIDLDINGLKYVNVYNKKSINFPDTIPKSIYYSHTQGIIRYDFSDSNYFEIINK